MLHIVLCHELLPVLLALDGQQLHQLVEAQIRKRLRFCLPAEKALLLLAIGPEHLHQLHGLCLGVPTALQPGAPLAVGELGLDLLQTPPDLDVVLDQGRLLPAGILLQDVQLRLDHRQRPRRRRPGHAELLAQQFAL